MAGAKGASVTVELRPGVNDDLVWISEREKRTIRDVQLVVASLCLEIASNGWLGDKMDPEGRDLELVPFRRVRFDFEFGYRGSSTGLNRVTARRPRQWSG